jgi:hypothetical protein
MSNVIASPGHGVKKLYISETVFFAINNIPAVDRTTLEKFLELVNATGTFGVLSHEQILTKMRLMLRYIPNACPHSLDILSVSSSSIASNNCSSRIRPVRWCLPFKTVWGVPNTL